MHVCPQCASAVDLARFRPEEENLCPVCNATLTAEHELPWTDVARVRNLAEAGFLCDELLGLGIEARIHQLEEFGATNARWASLYLIRVPSNTARAAVAQIRQHLAEEDPEENRSSATFYLTTRHEETDPALWRPFAIVILAGVASFVLGQRLSEQKAPKVDRRPPRDSLASVVEAIGQPLVSEPQAGQPRHRLTFDRLRQVWLLDVDRDGDGIYDSRQAFHPSGAAW